MQVELSGHDSMYAENGFCEGKFADATSVHQMIECCLSFLHTHSIQVTCLSEYHKQVKDEHQHRELHYELCQYLRKKRFHESLLLANPSVFTSIVGNDVDVQIEPYLRITRPGVYEDNIGLHRDTMYGNSAFEVSCIIPLVDFKLGGAVSVLRDSQNLGPLSIKVVDHESISKGSKQNQIGFLYSTKHIDEIDRSLLHTPLLKVQQFMMFSLGMIHGQEVNTSSITRWSLDFRFRSSYAPVNESLKQGYYRTLLSSPASQIGRQYYQANPDEHTAS